MKIVFLASRFPYPLLKGDQVRAYHFLERLHQQHQVTLITPYHHHADQPMRDVVRQICSTLELVPLTTRSAVPRIATAVPSSTPLQVAYLSDPMLGARLKEVVQRDKPDVVHIQLARLGELGLNLAGVPRVLDFIDALSLNMLRRGRRERGLKRVLFFVEAQRMAAFERRLCQHYDQATISSPLDRDFIGKLKNLHVVSNGVDLSTFPYHPPYERHVAQPTLIFTGRMSYFPNYDAVDYFLTMVLPQVRAACPSVGVRIVGADPPEWLRQKAVAHRAEVTGRVPSIAEALHQATIAIAPLRSGSGFQNKVIEAMAAGTPVIATSHAVAALDVAHDEHLLIGDTPDLFSQQIIRLLHDLELQQRLAQNAVQRVRQRYTWEASVRQLDEIYRQAQHNSYQRSA
ncbi:MAG: glycosyltransferase [Chloroflexota bacterium]|nr:glycosyltransferase [Chloroflexota bacterium]